MTEASLSKLDDKGVLTIVKVENIERKVGKEMITEINIKTERGVRWNKEFLHLKKDDCCKILW